MASDYKNIAKEHEKRYGWDAKPRRIYKRLYSDKTHFVYELIQNADDSKSQHLELQLDSNTLFVWNDGRQFKERDVRSICSLGSSDKDLTHIGTFGIGFKAVYNYTEFPEIYSDDERFRIRDFIKPEGIDEMTQEVEKLVKEGKTVFRLPFKNSLHQESDIEHLKDRLCNLSKERSLLFLRHLKKVEWKDERNAQTGSYSCHRYPYDRIQNIPENECVKLVKLTGTLNGNDKPSETFLVFRKKIHPPKDVIDKLLEQAEDEEEQQSIQQSADQLQPIEVAFKLQDDRITAMDDNCVLFAYLPTQKETHLKFLIQARYQTTPARDNIPEPSENPWNRWLVQETADFFPEVLEQLRDGGLLETTFFNLLPLEGEVENAFKPIAETLREAMRERAFVPTEKKGYYAKAENVFYPDSTPLRELIKSSGMLPDSSLLHPDIQPRTEKFSRCFKVMDEADVKKIDKSDMLFWLEKQSRDWFKNRTNEWLRSLYIYFNRKWSDSELERIKKLPLVRLENGHHVCASDQLVFFPPDTDEAREEIAPFLNELPILQSDLFEGDDCNDIEAFLENHLGVLVLNPADLIRKWIIPRYSRTDAPSKAQNCLHVGYLFKVWDKLSEHEHRNLKKEISETPILWAYNEDQPKIFDFVKPCDAYLSKAYTGDDHLETYFSVSYGDVWFIDDGYLESESDAKTWFQFLKSIGSIDTPRVVKVEVVGTYEECEKRGITRQRSTRPFEDGSFVDMYYSGHFDGAIVDRDFDGLLEILAQISDCNEVNLSHALWSLLVKVVKPLSPEKSRWSRKSKRDAFFQCTYHRFYQKPLQELFDATFYRQLKETAWLPDEQGNLQVPTNCFAPTDGNRRVLGDSVAYLHPDFDVSQDNETAQWLAGKLGVHLNADTDSVIAYLQTLSGTKTSVEKVEPLYRFLARQDARPREEFKQKSLIFTSNPEPRWWRSDEVFWEDESAVFGNSRGYLKEDYADPARTLNTFFHALGVLERAASLDYVYGIRDAASAGRAEEAEVRKRVKILYHHIMLQLREEDSSQEDEEWQEEWEQTREGRCWLGKKEDEWGFFSRNELVWNDHPYIAEIFQGRVPFWAFDDDLLEFAKDQGVKGCSEADVTFHLSGDREEDKDWSEKVRELRPYIDAFLKSPLLCEEHEEGKSAQILDCLSVCLVEKLKMTYTLKEIPVTCPNPHPSALDATNQEVTLWLALAADKNEYAELIGDALQDYFRVKELGRFIEDLLTKDRNRVLSRWNQKGLQEVDSKEIGGKSLDPVDKKLSGETDSGDDVLEGDESDAETPTVHENSETGNGEGDSTGNEPKTPTHQSHPNRSGTHPRGGNGSSTPNRSRGTGYSGVGGPGEEHEDLKDYIADNPSELGEGLKLVKKEHTFTLGGRVDILLQDSAGNPVTVEVKPYIPSGSNDEVWQAVRYKHIAAAEYGLRCDQVRSILAAPVIPDDVKMKCEQLGIEPFERPES